MSVAVARTGVNRSRSFFGWHVDGASLKQWYESSGLSSASKALKTTVSEQLNATVMVVVVVVVYIVYMNVFASVQRGTKVGLL